MKKLAILCLALALCAGLAVPAFAAGDYEEITIDYAGFFGSETVGQVTLDQARPVTSEMGYVYYYEVPAQVQVTVTLNENRDEEYQFAVRWFDADLQLDGYSNTADVAYALATPSGGLTEYPAAPGFMDYWDNQLTPGQSYTFTIQSDRSDAVILDCGPRNDFFLQAGIQLRCAGDSGQTEEPAPETPAFTDVPDWCANEVTWAAERGITGGTTPTTFSPDTTCNTAQILTFLWRAAGEPAASTDPFPETAGQYYADAAAWAHEEGLIESFEAGLPCTRSMVVEFLWKLEGSPVVSGGNTFTDVADDASCAQAVAWAVENDITGGVGGGRFAPDSTCTRGQIVTFLYRAFAE